MLLSPLTSLAADTTTDSSNSNSAVASGNVQPGAVTESKTVKGPGESGAACISWIDPDVTPWAAMLCVHGLGLADDAYTDFGKRMSALGIALLH